MHIAHIVQWNAKFAAALQIQNQSETDNNSQSKCVAVVALTGMELINFGQAVELKNPLWVGHTFFALPSLFGPMIFCCALVALVRYIAGELPLRKVVGDLWHFVIIFFCSSNSSQHVVSYGIVLNKCIFLFFPSRTLSHICRRLESRDRNTTA